MTNYFNLSNKDKFKLSDFIETILKNFENLDDINYIKNFIVSFKKEFPVIVDLYNNLLDGSEYLIIENLPDFNQSLKKNTFLSLLFSLLLGEPFQYTQQNKGHIVAEIKPIEGINIENSGESRDDFGWHTDDRIFQHPYRTQWIQLLGIKNTEKTPTYIVSTELAAQSLSQKDRAILMQKRFESRMPFSFGFSKVIWSEPIAVLWINQLEQYEAGIPTYNIRTIDKNDTEGNMALKHFCDAMEQFKESYVLKTGCLLIFNNDRIIHARPRIDGERLILRTYVREDLDGLRQRVGVTSNIFDARFLL